MKSLSHFRLFATPWTIAYQNPPSMGFSRQEYWSGLPFPSPGDLPDPGIEPGSPALQADALPSEPPGRSLYTFTFSQILVDSRVKSLSATSVNRCIKDGTKLEQLSKGPACTLLVVGTCAGCVPCIVCVLFFFFFPCKNVIMFKKNWENQIVLFWVRWLESSWNTYFSL